MEGDFTYDRGEYIPLAYTIKKCGGNPTKVEYLELLGKWSNFPNNGVIVYEPYFEEDSLGKLHVHGILLCKKHFWKNKFQTYGYSIYTTDIYCLEGWMSYINKTIPINNKNYMFNC